MVGAGVVNAFGAKLGHVPIPLAAAEAGVTATRYVYVRYQHSTLHYLALGAEGPGASIEFKDAVMPQDEMDEDHEASWTLLGSATFEDGEARDIVQYVEENVPALDADRGHCEIWTRVGASDVVPPHFQIVYPENEEADGPFLRMSDREDETGELTGAPSWSHGGNQTDTHGEYNVIPGSDGVPLGLSGSQIVEVNHSKYPQGYRVLLIRRR
jgi:hypothetical protein